jgi:hypothetical protein
MSDKRVYGVMWSKSLLKLAQCAWGFVTYLALLAGAAVIALQLGDGKPPLVAFFAVIFASSFNWMVFGMVEHGELKRLNK